MVKDHFIRASVELSKIETFLCVRPIVSIGYWSSYPTDVVMRLSDYDDMDIGVVYMALDEKEAKAIFHELVNYLNDIDGHLIPDRYLLREDWSNKGFPLIFPDLGCVRKME